MIGALAGAIVVLGALPQTDKPVVDQPPVPKPRVIVQKTSEKGHGRVGRNAKGEFEELTVYNQYFLHLLSEYAPERVNVAIPVPGRYPRRQILFKGSELIPFKDTYHVEVVSERPFRRDVVWDALVEYARTHLGLAVTAGGVPAVALHIHSPRALGTPFTRSALEHPGMRSVRERGGWKIQNASFENDFVDWLAGELDARVVFTNPPTGRHDFFIACATSKPQTMLRWLGKVGFTVKGKREKTPMVTIRRMTARRR